MATLAPAALAVLLCGLAPARAATTRIAAQLDAQRGKISGEVEFTFDNVTGGALDRVYVWLVPNRMARPPEVLDDVNYYWIYPRRFSPGSMRLTRVLAGPNGAERALARSAWRPEIHAVAGSGVLHKITLPAPVAPGKEVRVAMRYRAEIPERYGALGCISGQCTLAGGFYPMLAAIDSGGWDLAGPPMRTDMDVTVELAQPAAAVLFDYAAGHSGKDPVTRIQASRRNAPYASLCVAPRLYQSVRRWGRFVLRYLSLEPPPPGDDAKEQILPYTKEDYAGMGLDIAEGVLAFLRQHEAENLSGDLTMVEAPLRFDIARAHPGAVLVSDRAYRIWPARRFRKLHTRQLQRALFRALITRVVVARGRERARDIGVAAELLASYLTDLAVVRQHQTDEYLGDILRPVSFIPLVDQLLYRRAAPFLGAYFRSEADRDPLRDHPDRFMHQRPGGRLVYEKLRDLLRPEALHRAMRAMIRDGTRYRDSAESAYGSPLGWFFRQWSLPHPRVDYRLVKVSSHHVNSGLYDHEVFIERRVAAADHVVVEPVIVRFYLADGSRRDLRWNARGKRGFLRLRARVELDGVEIDPAGRLVERKLPGQTAHPLFSNRSQHDLRFIYHAAGALLNVTDLSALLLADFSLSRVHDLESRVRARVFSSASSLFGASLRYQRRFGPEVTPDRLLSQATLLLSGRRLRASFFGDERPASQLTVGLSFGRSTRRFLFHPKWAHDLGASASLTVTRRDAAGDGAEADYLWHGNVAASLARVVTPRGGHTLALELAARASLGAAEIRSQLVATGGAQGLRGYAPAGLFSRAAILARAEYRHVFVHDLAWNFGHYNIVRGLGGVLFADAAQLSSCESYDLTAAGGFHASLGYGLRAFYDGFGTLPQMMRLDVAVRLTGPGRDCLGEPVASSRAYAVYLRFWPPF